jgi:photosystem II stability/assembly factor-like uncharacterized protein
VSWLVAGPPPPTGLLVAALDSADLLLAGFHPACGRTGVEQPSLQRSVDGGKTWQAAGGGDGIRPLAIWADAGLAIGESCAGLQVSTDAGATWQQESIMESGYEVSAFAPNWGVDARSPAGLIVGTIGRTSQVWWLDLADPSHPDLRRLGLPPVTGGEAPAVYGDTYVVGAATGVFVSNDQGKSWFPDPSAATPITSGDAALSILVMAIDSVDPSHLYAGTSSGIFASPDAGRSWQRIGDATGIASRLVFTSAGWLLGETDRGVVALPVPRQPS